MKSISRRRFVGMLAGVPFLRVGLAPVSATTERSSLERSKVDAVELILRKLVDSGAVPGVSYSIGNRSETLAERRLWAKGRRASCTDGDENALSNGIC